MPVIWYEFSRSKMLARVIAACVNRLNDICFLWKDSLNSEMSTIPPISTKRTTTSRLKSLNTKITPPHITLEIQVLTWDSHKIGKWSPNTNVYKMMFPCLHVYIYLIVWWIHWYVIRNIFFSKWQACWQRWSAT